MRAIRRDISEERMFPTVGIYNLLVHFTSFYDAQDCAGLFCHERIQHFAGSDSTGNNFDKPLSETADGIFEVVLIVKLRSSDWWKLA